MKVSPRKETLFGMIFKSYFSFRRFSGATLGIGETKGATYRFLKQST